MPRFPSACSLYIRVVILAGVVVTGGLLATPWTDAVARHPFEFAALLVLVVLGELRPMRVTRNGQVCDVTPSTTFAFATLLGMGAPIAVVVQGVASLLADATHARSPIKAAFNAAQYALSLAVAGGVLSLLGGSGAVDDGHIGGAEVGAMAAAALGFFVVNNALVGAVRALAGGLPLGPQLAATIRTEGFTGPVLLGMGPVAALVGERSPVLLPVLLLPAVAVYARERTARVQEHQANHDALTGLPNRSHFRAGVERAVAHRGGDEAVRLAVLLMDLDRFKEINDTLGHHAGDELLVELGRRLTDALEGIGVVARLGGDEFAVLVAQADEEAARQLARRIITVVEQPYLLQGVKLDIEASVGIALHPDHGDDVDTLLQRADVAMYLAKEAHAGYELYTPARDQNSTRRLVLLGDLKHAIVEGRLHLVYQPQLDLATGRTVAVEALARWDHHDVGPVPPSEFVALAEHSGLIVPLTHLVLGDAVRQCRAWIDQGTPIRVAVNLSPRVLHDLDLPRHVAALLAAAGVPPELLCLEITESALMGDPVRALRVLNQLSAMGIRLAIDDFGTGYSSLAYLQQLPVSEVKIDRSFVGAMATGGSEAIIVRSTIDLARNLGLETTAEGVETPEVLAALVDLGCDLAQGYHIGRPVPAPALRLPGHPVLVSPGGPSC